MLHHFHPILTVCYILFNSCNRRKKRSETHVVAPLAAPRYPPQTADHPEDTYLSLRSLLSWEPEEENLDEEALNAVFENTFCLDFVPLLKKYLLIAKHQMCGFNCCLSLVLGDVFRGKFELLFCFLFEP